MKRFTMFTSCLLSMVLTAPVNGQSGFNPEDYMDFREENKDLTTNELLDKYPAPTTYYSHRVNAPDLSGIAWLDSIDRVYEITPDEKELLKKHDFMVTDRLRYHSWISAFAQIYTDDLPLFLSTDFFLFTLHQSYDEVMKSLEAKVLEPNLGVLLHAMHARYDEVKNTYPDQPDLNRALNDVDLYLAVARSLLEDKEILPGAASVDKYREIMGYIEAEKPARTDLFTPDTVARKFDFSQFKPRGHYTDLIYTPDGMVTLENYFRAMMWLGRIDFLMTAPPSNPWESDWTDAQLVRMNMGALVLNDLLYGCGKEELYDLHEELVGFLVGPADNLTPGELRGITSETGLSAADLAQEELFDILKVQLNASDDYGQKIMSNFFYVDPDTSDPSKLPVSYRLLGQKFLVDSYVLSEVVYDRIIYNGEKIYRGLPDPLDVMSVMGSEDAMALMEEEMETYKYAHKIEELKYLVDSYDPAFWDQSLYNTWLAAIRDLNPPNEAAGLPYFMQTTAWHQEKLNTQLTSWAQLRHDNLLYAKQSYTGGTGCSFPYTYVEPYPGFYNRLEKFARRSASFFEESLSSHAPQFAEQVTTFYNGYAAHMQKLKAIAEKELDRTPLSEQEITYLKTMVNSYMASGPSISGWINDLLFPSWDRWDSDFTVADVHTQPTDQAGNEVWNVLHVGNGMINLGVFLAPGSVQTGQKIAYVGPVGSFHTAIQKNAQRYDDDEWEERFLSGEYPERPDWVYSYLAGREGNMQAAGRELKGIPYTGSGTGEPSIEPMSYVLAFPNPASERVHFRFLLEQDADVYAEITDITGRVKEVVKNQRIPASEQQIDCNLSGYEPGVYVLLLKVNNKVYTRRFLVN